VILIAAGTALAQKTEREARRLESITWNPLEHRLTWTVNAGSMSQGKFEGGKKLTYEIKMDEAMMTFDGEDRRFSKTEAVSVHRLMDLVAKYAAESTLWWEAGEGERLGPESNSSKVDRKRNPKRQDLFPDRPQTDTINGKKVMRISFEGRELPVTVREIE
jgi:hypothetical protein